MTDYRNQSISSGTMRSQDLIPRFYAVLQAIAPQRASQRVWGCALRQLLASPDASPWWEAHETLELLDDLFAVLNEVAPPGFYFGAHEGDGSDYGFWESTDEIPCENQIYNPLGGESEENP